MAVRYKFLLSVSLIALLVASSPRIDSDYGLSTLSKAFAKSGSGSDGDGGDSDGGDSDGGDSDGGDSDGGDSDGGDSDGGDSDGGDSDGGDSDGGDSDGGDSDGGDSDGGDSDGGDSDGGDRSGSGNGRDRDDNDRDDGDRSGSGNGRDRDDNDRDDSEQDDNDRDDEDRDDDDRDDDASPTAGQSNLSPSIPSLSYSNDSVGRDNVFRSREISASRLDRASLSALTSRGFTVIRSSNTGTLGAGTVARLQTPSNISAQEALALARQLEPGALFDFSHLYGPSNVPKTYARAMVKMPASGNCVTRTRIGLIDSKVVDHESLRSANILNKQFSKSGSSGLHGTAVASIIVGRNPDGAELAGNTSLFVAEVFDTRQGSLVADAIDMIAAIDWMLENDVKVVNMSLSGPRNDLIGDAVAAAIAKGLIIVAAAGNEGPNGVARYPAAFDGVIATAAVDQRQRAYRMNSSGDHIDIAAPGVSVWAADARTGGGALWSGTSFAAPYVTTEIAAALEKGLISSPEDALGYLAQHAIDIGPKGVDPIFGKGLLQAFACK